MTPISIISFLALVSAPASNPQFVEVPQSTYLLPVEVPGAVNLDPSCDGTNPNPLALRTSQPGMGLSAEDGTGPKGGDQTISVYCQANLQAPSLVNADIAVHLKASSNVGLVLCDQLPCKPTADANIGPLLPGINTSKFEAARSQLATLTPGTLYYAMSFIPANPTTQAIQYVTGEVPVNYAGGTQVGNGIGNIAIHGGGSSGISDTSPLPATPASSATASAANCSLSVAPMNVQSSTVFFALLSGLFCLALRGRQARERKKVRVHLN